MKKMKKSEFIQKHIPFTGKVEKIQNFDETTKISKKNKKLMNFRFIENL